MVEAVTAEASRFSIQTTITWEIAADGVPVGVATGVGVGRADGAADARAEGAGVAVGLADGAGDGLAAGGADGPRDGADDGAPVGRARVALPDGLDVLADDAEALADGASVSEAAALAGATALPGEAGLTGGGVAWHAARRATSPRVAAARRGLIGRSPVRSRSRRLLV